MGIKKIFFIGIIAFYGVAYGATIKITSIPAFGAVPGSIQGTVTGVNASSYAVAPYIQIEGVGWWTKPSFATPTVAINANGTFSAPVVTGGMDNYATLYCAVLVPIGTTPPAVGGGYRIPVNSEALATDCVERYGRTVTFAGRTWGVKDAPGFVGPGGNFFSAKTSDVWVDSQGLHLTIHYIDGGWYSTEVVLLESLGYGTYVFKTKSRTDIMDTNATLGMFTWDPHGDDVNSGESHSREIDFEDSSWGIATDPNTQAVVQPWNVSGNRRRFNLPNLSADSRLTRAFTWKADSIRFLSLKGDQPATGYPQSAVFDDWTYLHEPNNGHFVPTPGREQIRLNLWINTNGALANGTSAEVIISDFSFIPAQPVITKIKKNGANVDLSFTSSKGYNYSIQSRTNLNFGSWSNLTGTYPGTGATAQTTLTNAATTSPKYFRIKQLP
ncbi:MAG: hypothetical protein WCG27_05255 [Pseudomonadota bacterium]